MNGNSSDGTPSAEALLHGSLHGIPLPVADALAALVAAGNRHEQRDRIVEVFRALVRYLGAVVLATRMQYGPGPGPEPPLVQDLVRTLRRRHLTDGQWVALQREALRPWAVAPAGHPIPELVAIFHGPRRAAFGRLLDGMLEMRREETVAHGGTGREAEIAALISKRLPQLAALVESARPVFSRARLVAPLALSECPDVRQDAWDLMRDTPARGRWPRVAFGEGVALPPGEPVLVDEGGRPLVALAPLAVFRRPSPEAVEEFFVLDGPKGRDALYLALPSMAEHRATQVWDALERDLLSEDVDREPEEAVLVSTRPYRGLEPFDEEHAHLFFGREREAEALANRIRRHAMVTVTGASGCGKTSLVRAGVWPRLDGWTRVAVRPGARPVHAMARQLERAIGPQPDVDGLADRIAKAPADVAELLASWCRGRGTRLALVVDQAEELFTITRDAAAAHCVGRFLASLTDAPDTPVHVVLAVREDFFARLSELDGLKGLYNRQVEVLTVPGPAGLRRALCEPAESFGYTFESDSLVAAMVEALTGADGALPLLQFCADRLWEQRDRAWKRITVGAYEALGGVEGALATHAERVFASLTPAQRAIARAFFVRLVTQERTRAVLTRDELFEGLADSREAEVVLERLVSSRLLTVRESESGGEAEARVELVHEALLTAWPRYGQWLAADLETELRARRVGQAAARWDAGGRGRDLLLPAGRPLDEGLGLLTEGRPLEPVVREFVERSALRARRQRRLRQLAVGALGGLFLLAAVLGLLAAIAAQRAEGESLRAQLQSFRATANETASRRQALRATRSEATAVRQRDLAEEREETARRNLALVFDDRAAAAAAKTEWEWAETYVAKALSLYDTEERRDRLLRARGWAMPLVWHGPWSADGADLVASDGERRLVTVQGNETLLWDARTGRRQRRLDESDHSAISASPDGRWIALTGSGAGWGSTVYVRDTRTGELRWTLSGHVDDVEAVAFSPDGALLASGGKDRALRFWDLETGFERAVIDLPGGGITSIAFEPPPDAELVAVGVRGALLLIRPRDGGFGVLQGERTTHDVAFSPDGAWLAAGDADGVVRLYGVEVPGDARELRGHGDLIYDIAFSPNGRRLASGGEDGTIRIWSVPEGRLERVIRERRAVYSLAWLEGGARLAAAGPFEPVQILDARSGRTCRRPSGHKYPISGMACTPDGAWLVTAARGGELNVWATDGWVDTARIDVNASFHTSLALGPDGRMAAAGLENGTVALVDLTARRVRARLGGRRDERRDMDIAIDATGTTLAAAAGSLTLWDLVRREPRAVLSWPDEPANRVTYVADGARFAVATGKGNVRLVAADSGEEVELLPREHEASVTAVAASRDGRWIVSGDAEGKVQVRQADRDWWGWSMSSGDDEIKALAISSGGRWVLSAVSDGVDVWDHERHEERRRLRYVHGGSAPAVTFTSDEARVVVADGVAPRVFDAPTTNRYVRREYPGLLDELTFCGEGGVLWNELRDLHLRDAETWAERSTVTHSSPPYEKDAVFRGVACSPDGSRIVVNEEGRVSVWGPDLGTRLVQLPSDLAIRSRIVFEPAGRWFAAGQEDGTVAIWAVDRARGGRVLEGHRGDVDALAVHPDGSVLASGGVDKTIRLWDVAAGEEIIALERLRGKVVHLDFHPGGSLLASATDDEVILVWDWRLGVPVRRLTGHEKSVSALRFHPEGRILASSDHEGVVVLWDWEGSTPIRRIRADRGSAFAWRPGGRSFAAGGWGGVEEWTLGEILRLSRASPEELLAETEARCGLRVDGLDATPVLPEPLLDEPTDPAERCPPVARP